MRRILALAIFMFLISISIVKADTETLYVNGFNSITEEWIETGSSPWLNNDISNYIYTKTDEYIHKEFTYTDSTGSGTINSVNLYMEIKGNSGRNDQVEIYIYNSSGWFLIASQDPDVDDYAWFNWDISTTLPSWTEIDGAKLYVVYQRSGSPSTQYIYLRRSYLYVDYTAGGADNPPYWSNNNTYPLSPTTYAPNKNYQFNITWQDDNGVSEVIFEFDGTNYSYLNAEISKEGDVYYKTLSDLTANPSGYSYKWFANDTSDQWNQTNSLNYVINKAKINVNLYLNGTQNSNKTYTYPEAVNATGESSALTPSLYRNGVYKGTNEQILLGNGTWEYKVNATGNENYTDNSTGVTYYALINKGVPSIQLWLNGSESDKTYNQYDIANFTAKTETGLTVKIASNMSGWIEPSGTTVVYNTTNMTQLGVFNKTAYTTGNQNWTSASVTHYATVQEAGIPPIITIQSPLNQTYNYPNIWANVTLNEQGDWCGRSLDNGANVTMTNSSGNWNDYMIDVPEGSHNVTFFCNNTQGYMGSETEWFSYSTPSGEGYSSRKGGRASSGYFPLVFLFGIIAFEIFKTKPK